MTRLAALLHGGDRPLTLRSPEIGALLAVTFLYPVVLCAVFFPTPTYDLREYINLGQTFPLYTWKQPPLQTWAAGLVSLTGIRDAWLYVLVAQVVTFAGLGYFVATARRFVAPEAAVPLVVLFCGSVYYSLAIPTMALNADQLQIPLWAGVVYHALAAARDDRWRDWLACGALIGVSFLAKYFAAVLVVVLLMAAAWEPTYRRIFGNVKLYAAGLVALPIVLIHAGPELMRGDAVGYGLAAFGGGTWSDRLWSLWHLVRSYVLYGLPALVGLAAIAWHGGVGRPQWPREPAQRVLVFVSIAFAVAMLAMIAVGGLLYTTRYAFPFFGLALLALVCVVRIAPAATPRFARTLLALWIAIVIGTAVYALMAINTVLREPAAAAAAALRAAWERQLPCGPAYLVGDSRSAWAIAIYYGSGRTGVGFEEATRRDWFDPERARRLGLIVVTTPDRAATPAAKKWLGERTPTLLELRYRRTPRMNRHAYVYAFVPPEDCSSM